MSTSSCIHGADWLAGHSLSMNLKEDSVINQVMTSERLTLPLNLSWFYQDRSLPLQPIGFCSPRSVA
ncbi:hypothetical protein [Synechococcus sp. M16CYN]|uniref:hypothetical protein n=1 Tax=Synechococcus sp. M16CYN TaxID=3103139 RepID=UPI003340AB00